MYFGGSWAPDYTWNPLLPVAAKETALTNLRTAIGAGTWITAETAWRMAGGAINPNDLGDYYYCLNHWPSH